MAGLILYPILIWLFHRYGLLTPLYDAIGIRSSDWLWLIPTLLLASLVNIPLASIKTWKTVLNNPVRNTFDLSTERRLPISINLGGAVAPIALSVYLIYQHQLALPGIAVSIFAVGVVAYFSSRVNTDYGILISAHAALLAGATALFLGGENRAAWAYSVAVIGTLIGGDLLKLKQLGNVKFRNGAIGGAGVLDALFTFGILAAAFAQFMGQSTLYHGPRVAPPPAIQLPKTKTTSEVDAAPSSRGRETRCSPRIVTQRDGSTLLTNQCTDVSVPPAPE